MGRKIPSTQALMCFEAAARHQSYTRAAQELALTQSAVSRQIAALEDYVGLPLFRRHQHGVSLTPAGQDYARQVALRLAGLERDTLDVMAHRGEGGAVSLAAVPTFATRWLIPRLPALAQAQPQLLVHIETRTRPFLFADSGFDAALYAGTPEQVRQWAGTQAHMLLPEEVVPVCSPQWLQGQGELSPDTLAQLPLLQQTTRPDAWRHWFEAQGVDAPQAHSGPRYELFSMQAAAAAHGLGMALLPRLLIADELRSGSLVVACQRPLRGQRGYYLVRPEQAPERPWLDIFQHWLEQTIENELSGRK